MFSIWKPYGFHMENVKGRQSETDTEPFNHTLIHIRKTNLSEKLEHSLKTVLIYLNEGIVYRLVLKVK